MNPWLTSSSNPQHWNDPREFCSEEKNTVSRARTCFHGIILFYCWCKNSADSSWLIVKARKQLFDDSLVVRHVVDLQIWIWIGGPCNRTLQATERRYYFMMTKILIFLLLKHFEAKRFFFQSFCLYLIWAQKTGCL